MGTCVCYCAGALMWWGPNFAFTGAKSAAGNTSESNKITLADISFKFGIVMTLSGLLGVPLGSYITQMIRHQVPNADPIVCASTLLCLFQFSSLGSSRPTIHFLSATV